MPFPLSVTAESVPNVVDSVTVAPPVVRLFPFASFACTVIVVVLVPLAVIDDEAAVIVDVAALITPGTNVTTSLSAIEDPPRVPVMVAVPVVVEDVKVAVYVPFPLSVTDDNVPFVVDKTGVHALAEMFPSASFSCTVIVAVLVPLAVMLLVLLVIVVFAVVAIEIFTLVLGKFVQAPLPTNLR